MSRLTFSDEQRQFRDFVARFFREQSPVAAARAMMISESGFDAELWRRLGGEFGLTGVHVPEAFGGQGFGAVELGIVLEEMGRVMYCGPYFGSAVLATYALLEGATAAQQERWLPSLAAGDIIGSLALAEPGGGWEADAVQTSAQASSGRWRLQGTKSYVLDGPIADLFIVAAREPGSAGSDGVSLFAVQAGTSGLEVEPLQTIDATRRLSRLRLSGVEAELLGEPGSAASALCRVIDRAAVALASEMVGGAQALLDSAVNYARLRLQFGRLIGSFQAIKHKCADMLLAVELAKSAAYGAAEEMAAGGADADEFLEAAALAKTLAAEAFLQAAADTIQIHGGIGFTWENDTHLYFKRARGSEVLLGTPAAYRDRFVEHVSAREIAYE